MKRLIYFSLGLLLVVGFFYVVSRPESPALAPGPEPDEVPVSTPLEIDVDDEEVTPEEPGLPAEPLAVAIMGRVVGPSPSVAGARLVLDEESATAGARGEFRFEPAIRPRTASLSCELGGQSAATWDVVVGSETDEADVSEANFQSAPARVDWIRWTLNAFAPPVPTDGLWIHADTVLVEEWGNGGRVQVLGRTNVPDGAHIAGSVYFDDMRSFSSFDSGVVQGGEFRVVLWGVAGHRLFSGRYVLKLDFNEVFELPSVVEDWTKTRPEISTWSLTAEQSIVIGDEEQALSEDRAAQAYYAEVRDAVAVLRTTLRTRVFEIQRLGRRWDPQLLRDRADAQAGWFQEEMVNDDGHLAEDVWRAFLDRRWRPEVDARIAAHSARGPQKYQEAEGRVQSLLNDLLRESYVYSRFVVYPIFNLPGHANDFFHDESGAGDLMLLDLRYKKNVEGLERFCRLVEDAGIRRPRSQGSD